MTLSNDKLNQTIPEAALAGNNLTKILALTDTSSDVAKIALGIESLGFFIKHILSDLATYDLGALRDELYGDNIQTFNEITHTTEGIGLVPIGVSGSPQPQDSGTLLSFGPEEKKVQLLAFNSGMIWFRVVHGDVRANNRWHKINEGIVSHRFYNHTGNNMVSPNVQTHTITVPETAQTVKITLWGAGGGGGTPEDWRSGVVTAAYIGQNAGSSTAQYFNANGSLAFNLTAAGGLAGNDQPVPAGELQSATAIPDATAPSTTGSTKYSIAGGGMPGGISEKIARLSFHIDSTVVLAQDGLAGELSVGSFDVTGPGQLVITLAPGGRNAGYDGDNFQLNGFGYIGKAAAAEVIMF